MASIKRRGYPPHDAIVDNDEFELSRGLQRLDAPDAKGRRLGFTPLDDNEHYACRDEHLPSEEMLPFALASLFWHLAERVTENLRTTRIR